MKIIKILAELVCILQNKGGINKGNLLPLIVVSSSALQFRFTFF